MLTKTIVNEQMNPTCHSTMNVIENMLNASDLFYLILFPFFISTQKQFMC